jgi:xanthine/uracil permease
MTFSKAIASILAGIVTLVGMIVGSKYTDFLTPEVQGVIVTIITTLAAALWKDGKTVIYADKSEAAAVVADPTIDAKAG